MFETNLISIFTLDSRYEGRNFASVWWTCSGHTLSFTRAWCKLNMATQWWGVMIPNRSCTKDKKRREVVNCDICLTINLCIKMCIFKIYMWCKGSSTFPNFSLQQVCTSWIVFTCALLFTHVYCILYIHSPSWRR